MKRIRLAAPSQERIVLDDGRELLLRPVDPLDAEPIQAAFALLSPEEIRLRYQHPIKSLSAEYLERLTRPERGRDFVLVVAEPLPPGEALICAVARMSRRPATRDAEFAIIVSRFVGGQGLGRLMLKQLIVHARRCHLCALVGDVLEDNQPMLKLAESLGFRREASEHAGMARVRLALAYRERGTQAPAEPAA